MRFLMRLAAGLLLVLFCFRGRLLAVEPDPYGEFIAKTDPKTPEEEHKTFHLPPGFEIELVASEPAIIKPINMNFDDRGRLWVTQSVEYPFPAKGHEPRDTVKILESTNRDGVADKITTFVGGLNIPIGILPVTRGAIVYSIPNIYRFTDDNGDDHSDRRQRLYGKIGEPVLKDTHGMTSAFTWGFDGWIYACHGFSNDSVLEARDGSKVVMNSGNTYRMRADGLHIEQWTHGQVNPFGLCFDPLGNLFSADCHTKPIMMLLRNGYYQSFGKPDDGLGFAPEMCFHDHGSTAIAGIVYYAADQFPPAYRDTVFVGNVVTNRINHDRLEKHGSTVLAIEQPDFLACDDPWFRPVDIKLGPDGALYIADFYNRIIGHYEVPLTHPMRDHTRGRIWRIYYRGKNGNGRPIMPNTNWDKARVPDLVAALTHPNLVVRMKATNQLVERVGGEAIQTIRGIMTPQSNPFQRIHGLWVLDRLHALDDGMLQAAANDAESSVRVHAMRVLAERPQLSTVEHTLAVVGLKDANALVQRTAAEVLETHPGPENMRALLDLRHAVPSEDTHLLYVVRQALRDQLRLPTTWAGMVAASWSEHDRRAIADVAPGVPSAEAAAYLLAHVQHVTEPPDVLLRYVHHIARYGTQPTEKGLLTFARSNRPEDTRHQAALFKAIQQGGQERGAPLADLARQWAEGLVQKLLASRANENIQVGAELAGSLQLKTAQHRLERLVMEKWLPEDQRRTALDALMSIDVKSQVSLLIGILEDGAESLALRERTAQLLANSKLPQARAELIKVLAVAPAPLQTAITGGLVGSEQGATQLLDAVAAGKASARLLQIWLVHLQLDKYANLKERVAKLTQGLPSADARLEELIKKRRAGFLAHRGDAALGLKVFEKNCAICHQIGGKGAKVGPQLDGVGVRGTDRLLEDIIDPNRNVDQAFRATTLVLKNGQVVSGLVLREEGEVVVLADAQGKEVRFPKSQIDERTVSQMSPMPANLIEQIPEPDFYNLLAYLLAQRPPATAKTAQGNGVGR
jgi:putative heme-binding domain-containing protein